jgi:hypothetical protein
MANSALFKLNNVFGALSLFLIFFGPWLVPDSGHAKLVAKVVTSGSGPEAGCGPGPAGNGNDRKRRTGQA